MSAMQRRIVAHLHVYERGEFAHGENVARRLGVNVQTIRYHAKKLEAKGVIEARKGPDGGYRINRKQNGNGANAT